jgi:LacI family repressor for deo operon, udp, cdd, tsx, nupC, and nupG
MAKLTDVAKLANVSTATVSRVLSNTGKVSDEKAKQVMDAVQKLNYHPNVLGRQLRKMETKTILVVVPDITNTFFSDVLKGIENIGEKNGYQILLADTQNQPEKESEFLTYLDQQKVDGIILLTARTKKQTLNRYSENYPIVLACEYVENSKIPTVSIDNVSSARKVTNHFITLGHQRIAHITGPMEVVLSRDRLLGYRQALSENDLDIEEVLIQEGDFSYESGYHIMKKLLALSDRPTAVFASNDEMAIGAIKAINHHHLSVPEDIAVIGFDDIKMASIMEPNLTTIAQPAFEIGKKAFDLLIDLMKHEEVNLKHFVLNDSLVIRSSCGTKLLQAQQR